MIAKTTVVWYTSMYVCSKEFCLNKEIYQIWSGRNRNATKWMRSFSKFFCGALTISNLCYWFVLLYWIVFANNVNPLVSKYLPIFFQLSIMTENISVTGSRPKPRFFLNKGKTKYIFDHKLKSGLTFLHNFLKKLHLRCLSWLWIRLQRN